MAKRPKHSGSAAKPSCPQLSQELVVHVASFAELSCVASLAAASSWMSRACAEDSFWHSHISSVCPELLLLRRQIREPAPHRAMIKQYLLKPTHPPTSDFSVLAKFGCSLSLVVPFDQQGGKEEFSAELGDAKTASTLYGHVADMCFDHEQACADRSFRSQICFTSYLLADRPIGPPRRVFRKPELVVVDTGTGDLARLRMEWSYDNRDTFERDGVDEVDALFTFDICELICHGWEDGVTRMCKRINMHMRFEIEPAEDNSDDSIGSEGGQQHSAASYPQTHVTHDARVSAAGVAAAQAKRALTVAEAARIKPPFLALFESDSDKTKREELDGIAHAASEALRAAEAELSRVKKVVKAELECEQLQTAYEQKAVLLRQRKARVLKRSVLRARIRIFGDFDESSYSERVDEGDLDLQRIFRELRFVRQNGTALTQPRHDRSRW